jgi:hypothetical protein
LKAKKKKEEARVPNSPSWAHPSDLTSFFQVPPPKAPPPPDSTWLWTKLSTHEPLREIQDPSHNLVPQNRAIEVTWKGTG